MNRRRDTATSLAISVVAAVAAVASSLVVIALTGHSAMDGFSALWHGAFGGRTQVAATLARTIPLMLVALGWIVAFRAKRVNIGFEGQILAGGVGAAVVGISLGSLPTIVHVPLAVLAGMIAGALWIAIPALLWAGRGVNEIITTLMFNFLAANLVSWLVRGPLQEKSGSFDRTDPIKPSGLWPRLLDKTPLHWDLLLALALVVAVAFVLNRTRYGAELRFTGANDIAARYQGINTIKVTVTAMLASGALAGLAGSSLVLAGETRTMSDNFSANYGYEGIVVALLAGNNPAGCIPAALLFAFLRQGGGLLESRVGVSSAVVRIAQGLVIVLVAGAAMLAERRKDVRVDAVATAVGGPKPPAAVVDITDATAGAL